MKRVMKAYSKIPVLLVCVLLMLTSCSMLPTVITDTISGDSPRDTADESGTTVTISREEYNRLKQYEELDEIKKIVEQMYYQEPDNQALLDGAEMGLLYGLDDPYTFYYTPEDFAQMWEDDQGDYAGIGIQIMGNYSTGLCTISRVFLDSPALDAGIRKGDILVKVDDLDVTTTTLNDAVAIMRGTVGETVNVSVLRNEDKLDFVLSRAKVHVNWVNSCMLENDVGYIYLYEFSGDCSTAFKTQLDALTAQGAKALIMDLRDNPGGWVDDAVKVADMFLPEGDVAYLQYRDGTKEYYTTKDGATDMPLVVLVNEFSASASEILSGALQDRERATIVGVTTYGKGVVQNVIPIGSRGAGMQITVAQYFTPNGNEVHHKGIAPDVTVEMQEEDMGKLFEMGDLSDVQLNKAYEEALKLIGK